MAINWDEKQARMEQCLQNIRRHEDVRSSLITLKNDLKITEDVRIWQHVSDGSDEDIMRCLSDPDAKVRKNAAAILGFLECDAAKDVLMDARLNTSSTLGFSRPYTVQADIYLKDQQEIDLAGFHIQVFHTPGHTKGGCCYYIADQGIIFVGDTLFAGSIGRTDLPTGSMSQLIRGVKEKLFVLPEETIVCPGHMSETTIGHEKQYNPFF